MAYLLSDWQAGTKPPKGWDVADCVRDGWTKADIDAFMRAAVRPWSPPAPPSSEPPTDRPSPPAGPAPASDAGIPVSQTTVREARTTQQAKPEQATVTDIRTRRSVAADENWMLDLVCGEEGKIKPGVSKNWALFLESHPDLAGTFAWDAFKLRTMLMRKPPWDWQRNSWEPRPVTDRDYSEAVMWLEARHLTPKASNISAVIQTVAERNTFDRLTEFLEGLSWDGQPRIATFLSYYFGMDHSVYTGEVGKNWLVSSVARGLRPGSKVDTMPILEGPQGLNKSTAVKALYGPEFFSDNLSDIGTKDAMMEMQGIWGLEVAEMHRFSAAETNAVKKFLSRDTDRFRPPYGRNVIDAPRRVVMTGTINPEGNAYLLDPTGARRFWPLVCGRIDIDGLGLDREQLWAEAVTLFKAGSKWWVDPENEEVNSVFKVEQEKRTDVDVWVDLIIPLLVGRVSIAQVDIFEGLKIPAKDVSRMHSMRVGRIMKRIGWVASRDRKSGEDRLMFTNPNIEVGQQEEITDW